VYPLTHRDPNRETVDLGDRHVPARVEMVVGMAELRCQLFDMGAFGVAVGLGLEILDSGDPGEVRLARERAEPEAGHGLGGHQPTRFSLPVCLA
jgi:hypothetical protein